MSQIQQIEQDKCKNW